VDCNRFDNDVSARIAFKDLVIASGSEQLNKNARTAAIRTRKNELAENHARVYSISHNVLIRTLHVALFAEFEEARQSRQHRLIAAKIPSSVHRKGYQHGMLTTRGRHSLYSLPRFFGGRECFREKGVDKGCERRHHFTVNIDASLPFQNLIGTIRLNEWSQRTKDKRILGGS
jgi:hypothetical protein